MQYSIDSRIFSAYPGFMRVVIVAEDIDNSKENTELTQLLRESERKTCALPDTFKELPQLAVWADVFRSMGLNPNKYPPSVVNLVKRARSGKELPYVNSLVAAFNCISLRYLCPCGGDDLDAARGDLLLTFAKGDEKYVPLGRPEEHETPPPGEVIYMDTASKDVFCRAWCWKNGDTSKLGSSTKRAAINIDIMPPYGEDEATQICSELRALLERCTGARTRAHLVTVEHASFMIEE